MAHTVFVISPADCAGARASQLGDPTCRLPLAQRLRSVSGVPIGEVFGFISALYFRGKLAYAETFASPPNGCAGVRVIAPGRGLLSPQTPVTHADLAAMARVPVDIEVAAFRQPLERDAAHLRDQITRGRVVLLGSVATDKYVSPLLKVLGTRLHVLAAFVGRGSMSRGGLLLRAVRSGRELSYIAVAGAERRGTRPPPLGPPPA